MLKNIIMADQNSGYRLTKQWFDFCRTGTHIVRPIHTALYLYCVQLCNSLKWKLNFGLPTDSTMEVLGIKNKETYYNTLDELCRFGFVIIRQKSINQHTSNIICLPKKPISIPIGTHVGTTSGTVPIVKRIKHNKTLVNDFLKTGLLEIFKTVRHDVPQETLEIEAGMFISKYPDKDLKKDINLITTWAKRIKYVTPVSKMDEFNKLAAQNKQKYGL